MPATAVTPGGVRDGDPHALAGLCERRGPAVLAYCEIVVGNAQAVAAAAEAFASFRAGVVATDDLTNIRPEALLISATRHTAARYAGADAPVQCAHVPALLAARADRSITLADYDWLQEHLPNCWTCRAPVARFEAADRAYSDPPATSLAPEATAAMVVAMTAAAPVVGLVAPIPGSGAANKPPSANGAAAHGANTLAADYVDQPTAAWQIGVDDVEPEIELPDPEPAATAASEQPAERSSRRRPFGVGLASRLSPRRKQASEDGPAPAMEPATEPTRTSRISHLRRARRTTPASSPAQSQQHWLKPGVVLPIVLVFVAIVVALLIAGVFGGREGASSPQSLTGDPSRPAQTSTTPVVVVPGADGASAEEIERAKARRRAAERATTGDTDAASTPAAASQPPSDPAASATPATEPRSSAGEATPSGETESDGSSSNTSPNRATPSEDPPPPGRDPTAPVLPAPAPPAAPG